MFPENPTAAFTDQFVQNERALYGYVFSMVANRADTDDIVQSTLIQLWENFEKYDPERPFLPWAFRFAYRQVLMHRRSEKARTVRFANEDLIAKLAEDYEEAPDWQQDREAAIQKCVGSLSDDHRALVAQRYTAGATLDKMSKDLGRTPNALYKTMQRIRLILAKCVEKRLSTS
ncbi:MAG: sigma-70 family RNA polymerase sigma factor [Akkermansiaceae bacterium]|jgi:RNA polymerase sigma-70 factor (ECF subfamily)